MSRRSEHDVKRGSGELVVMSSTGALEDSTRRRTHAAAKGPETEWSQQRDQEQSSDDLTMRLHG